MSARFLEEISEELSISSGSTVGRWRSSVEAWLSARVFDRVPDCVNSQGPFLYEVHGIEGCE
jgi:hypothetical protein